MSADHTLPDVRPSERRSLEVTRPTFSPENVVVTAVYDPKPGPRTKSRTYYPVEVRQKDLLDALGAAPDETDYREVVEENARLGKLLGERVAEGHRIRRALKLPDLADERVVLARIEELEKDDQAPEPASDEERAESAQFDRSWALEKAAGVLRDLSAVGAFPPGTPGVALVALAEWILSGETPAVGEADRG